MIEFIRLGFINHAYACEECGSLVLDPQLHVEWHEKIQKLSSYILPKGYVLMEGKEVEVEDFVMTFQEAMDRGIIATTGMLRKEEVDESATESSG